MPKPFSFAAVLTEYDLDTLQAALEALDNYADVDDGPDGQPVPNRAMRAADDLEALYARLDRLCRALRPRRS